MKFATKVKSIETSWTISHEDVWLIDRVAEELLSRQPCFKDLIDDLKAVGGPNPTPPGSGLCPFNAATATNVSLTDIDIWRAAHLLVKQHGKNAARVAAHRADELFAKGDIDGENVSKRIVSAVNELQRPEHMPGDAIN